MYYVIHRYYVAHNTLENKGIPRFIMPRIGIMCGIITPCKEKANPSKIKGFAWISKRFEPAYKPSSVVYGHLSRLTVTDKLKRCLRRFVGRTALLTNAQSCNGWGLHGITRYRAIGELLPRLSILTKQSFAVYFCCNILEVTFT